VRRPRRILNLPPINSALRQLRDLRLRANTFGGRPHPRDEGGPHLFFGLLCEFAEMERDVDAREECFIEGFDAAGGKEEDAAVILDVAEANLICVS
jgi:hypothetical protein